MPFILRNLTLQLGQDEKLLFSALLARFSLKKEDVTRFDIIRKGIDARKKPHIRFVYTVEFAVTDEEGLRRAGKGLQELEYIEDSPAPVFPRVSSKKRIVITGMGPAGLFAALRLAEYGLTAMILERGNPVEQRVRDVQTFWNGGGLNTSSNVQFGEGGAGTFSDGKLTTRVRDCNIRYVLNLLVQFGAPPEIIVAAKPHIGTDRLRHVIVGIRRHLESRGFCIGFGRKLTDMKSCNDGIRSVEINGHEEVPCDILLLAPGHSARDTYGMLQLRAVKMEAKPFAIGLRVEHPQELINRIQYGLAAHPQLPAADYALAYNDSLSGRSAYSFCMCPGGVVVAGASEEGGVVTNGMSGYFRNAPCANSALVVTVGPGDYPGDGPLAGVEFQRRWERSAFAAAGGDYRAPAQNLMAFLGDKKSGVVRSSYLPGVCEVPLSEVLPPYVCTTLRDGIRYFEGKMRGFITDQATLTGVETRTSAPLRILRGADMQSVSMKGLFPIGEGAGYAGGIMSAALDGIKAAEAVAQSIIADAATTAKAL